MANEDEAQPPRNELARRVPSDGLDEYYAAVLALLRASFMRVSKARISDLPWLSSDEVDPTSMLSSPAAASYPIPPEVGFQLVSVVSLADCALIAFRWHEAGEECFVYVVNLSEFARRNLAAGMAETIIVTNLLERLGKGWHRRTPLTRISGLTFIENSRRPPAD